MMASEYSSLTALTPRGTSGQEKFRSLTTSYYRDASAVVILPSPPPSASLTVYSRYALSSDVGLRYH